MLQSACQKRELKEGYAQPHKIKVATEAHEIKQTAEWWQLVCAFAAYGAGKEE